MQLRFFQSAWNVALFAVGLVVFNHMPSSILIYGAGWAIGVLILGLIVGPDNTQGS